MLPTPPIRNQPVSKTEESVTSPKIEQLIVLKAELHKLKDRLRESIPMLLATRQKQGASTSSSTTASESSLFAGLSFPEVPTTLIERSTKYEPLKDEDDAVIEQVLDEVVSTAGSSCSSSSSSSSNSSSNVIYVPPTTGTAATSSSSSSSATTSTTATTRTTAPARSLAALYTPTEMHIPTGEYCYPDLPIDIVSMNVTTQAISSSPTARSAADDDASESSALLAGSSSSSSASSSATSSSSPSTVSAFAVSKTPSAPHLETMEREKKAEEDANLVKDLIAENTLMAQELERLRSQLNAPPASAGPALAASSSSSSSSSSQGTASYGIQQQQQQQNPMTQYHQPTSSTMHRDLRMNPPLPMPALEPRPGTKYVCCGRCRTWLSAPHTAEYVRCPGCQVINNCTAPLNGGTLTHPPQSTALQSSTVSSQYPIYAFFQNCFRGTHDPPY